MANFCIKCGSALAPGDLFCKYCGRSTVSGVTPPRIQPGPPQRQTPPVQPQYPQAGPAMQSEPPRTAQPQPSTAVPAKQPEAAPAKPRRSGAAIALSIILSVVMVIEVALMAFWQPGFLRKKPDGSGGKDVYGQTTVDPRKDPGSADNEDTGLPEWPFHSKALDISPLKGFRVTAAEGALYDDTEIKVRALGDEDYDRIAAIEEDLEKEGKLMVWGWEVDAGLEEDEYLPEGYQVSIDLSRFDIPESLYPYIQIARVTDSGTFQTYHTELDGNTLSYEARQNSLFIVLVSIGVVAFISLATYLRNKPDIYYWFQDGKGTKVVEHNGNKYTLRWLMKDVDPDQQKALDRIAEIEAAHRNTAQEDYDEEEAVRKYSSALYRMFNKNQSVAERLKDLIAADKEYQSLVQTLQVPEFVKMMIEMINTSYDYLKNVECVKLPDYDVDFYLIVNKDDKGNYGESDATVLRRSWININVAEAEEILYGSEAGKRAKDNMLLTVTHELFHVCQNMYHHRLLGDSSRFDEMVTLVLESDAKNWYTAEGIITTDPRLTEARQWNLLTLSMDTSNKTMGIQGYMLSLFVQYLRKATGKTNVTALNLMHTRRYYTTPITSEPLMKAFKLTEAQFLEHFRGFCVENKRQIAMAYQEETDHSNKLPIVAFDKGEGCHVSFGPLGDYTAAMRGFLGNTKEKCLVPLLVVMDPGALENHPGCFIEPVEKYEKTPNGFYVPAYTDLKIAPSYMKVQGRQFILEVYGKDDKPDGLGYTVYRMLEPEAPKLSLENGNLKIQLPEPQGAAKDGVLDGLVITIQASDGTKKEVTVKKDEFGKTQSIPVDELKDRKTEGTPSFTVTISEFVKDAKGNLCFGLPSKEAEIKGGASEWVNAYEYFGSASSAQLFEAMEKANVRAMRVTPLGFYGTSYQTKKDQVFPIDNTASFVIDLTEGAVTEWSTTLTSNGSSVTYSITFTASHGSMYMMTAVTTYTGSKEGKTPGNALIVMNQIDDIPEIKKAFSVNRNNTKRMLFMVEEVLLP